MFPAVRLRIGFAATVLAALGAWLFAADAVRAQAPPADADRETEAFINRIGTLVLPQQKQLAREIIKERPGTPLAELAQKLLAEYELYEELAAREQLERDARTRSIREFWDAGRVPAPSIPAPLVTLVSDFDEPVLYQVRLPSMKWTGPYRLRPGQTHRYRGPVLFRRVTADGVTAYMLTPYTRYVFSDPRGTGTPRLFVDGAR